MTAFLRQAGAEARVEEFPAGTPTAEEAARAIGCPLERIVKSLLLECDGRPVLAMVPGHRRADVAKVAAAAGAARARVASPDRVRRLPDFAPGAEAPFPPAVELALLDRGLLKHERVWVGAGSPRHMAGLAPAELVRLTRAVVVDIADEGGGD